MEDEDRSDEQPPADADKDDLVPKSAFEQAIADRQKAKERARAAEAKVAEYEAAQKEARQAALREAENFAELEKELRAELEQKDAAVAEKEQTIAQVHKQYRQEHMLTALTEKTGQPRYVVGGLLAMAEREGLDVAPENVDDKTVDSLVRHFKKNAPELFKVESRGGSPGIPGDNPQTGPNGEPVFASESDRVKHLAKMYSTRRGAPTTMPT